MPMWVWWLRWDKQTLHPCLFTQASGKCQILERYILMGQRCGHAKHAENTRLCACANPLCSVHLCVSKCQHRGERDRVERDELHGIKDRDGDNRRGVEFSHIPRSSPETLILLELLFSFLFWLFLIYAGDLREETRPRAVEGGKKKKIMIATFLLLQHYSLSSLRVCIFHLSPFVILISSAQFMSTLRLFPRAVRIETANIYNARADSGADCNRCSPVWCVTFGGRVGAQHPHALPLGINRHLWT